MNDERTLIRGGQTLYDYLGRELAALADVQITVHIRASYDTPVRFLVEAARICDALGVEKSFEVQLPAREG